MPILNHMKHVYTILSCCFNIQFNITLPNATRFPKWIPPLLSLFHVYNMPPRPQLTDLINLIMFNKGYK